MPLVELRGFEVGERGTSLPVGSGRWVTFTRAQMQACVTEAEYQSKRSVLQVVGDCDEDAIEPEPDPEPGKAKKKEGCKTCGGAIEQGPARIKRKIDDTVLCEVANFSESFAMLFGSSGRCYRMRKNGSRLYVLEVDQRAEPDRYKLV